LIRIATLTSNGATFIDRKEPVGPGTCQFQDPCGDISSNIKLNPKRGVSTHLASKEDHLEMKDRIKTRVTLQRDRTVTKLEAIEDRATDTWHFRFMFRDQSGKVRAIMVPGDIAFSARTLLPQLHKAGARLPSDEKEAKRVVDAAIAQEPTRVVHCVARPGWQVDRDGTLRYSDGNKLIGPPARNIAPPFDIKRRGPSGKVVKGSLLDWQRKVGATAKNSPAATLLISAAFAAPLLLFAEVMTFGLVVYGRSKKGKSVVLNAGGSVIGLGLEENLLTLNATGSRNGDAMSAPSHRACTAVLTGTRFAHFREPALFEVGQSLLAARRSTFMKHASAAPARFHRFRGRQFSRTAARRPASGILL
jgi:uncharacterized protein (DUF927 family)